MDFDRRAATPSAGTSLRSRPTRHHGRAQRGSATQHTRQARKRKLRLFHPCGRLARNAARNCTSSSSRSALKRGKQGAATKPPPALVYSPARMASTTSAADHRAGSSVLCSSLRPSRSAGALRDAARPARLPAPFHANTAEQRREVRRIGDRGETDGDQPTNDRGARILELSLGEEPLRDPGQGLVQAGSALTTTRTRRDGLIGPPSRAALPGRRAR